MTVQSIWKLIYYWLFPRMHPTWDWMLQNRVVMYFPMYGIDNEISEVLVTE